MNLGINTLRTLLGSAVLALALGGCGDGGGTTSSSTTLDGMAMAGPFLSGTVCAYDAANHGQIGHCSTIASATSTFSIDVGDFSGDLIVEVSNATYDDEANPDDNVTGTHLAGTLRTLVHVTSGSGTVSVAVTPLTEAALRLAGEHPDDASLRAALARLAELFPALGNLDLRAIRPDLTNNLGLAYRQGLRALSQMQWAAGAGYRGDLNAYLNNLLAVAGGPNTLAAEFAAQLNSGLNSHCALANNVLACTLPTGNGGSGGAAGDYTLTVTVTGVPAPLIVLSNVPKPATQSEFCGDTQVQSALQNLSQAGATLTIDSCAFNGTTGSISATVHITSPMAMTVPYTVDYTYSGGSSGGSSGSGGVNGPTVDAAQVATLCPGARTTIPVGITQYSGCDGRNITQSNMAVLNTLNSWFSAHGTGMTVYNSNHGGVAAGDSCSFGIEPGLGLWLLTVNNLSVALTPGSFDGSANSIIQVSSAGEIVYMALGDFSTATGGREISFMSGKLDVVYQSMSGGNTNTLFCGNAN